MTHFAGAGDAAKRINGTRSDIEERTPHRRCADCRFRLDRRPLGRWLEAPLVAAAATCQSSHRSWDAWDGKDASFYIGNPLLSPRETTFGRP